MFCMRKLLSKLLKTFKFMNAKGFFSLGSHAEKQTNKHEFLAENINKRDTEGLNSQYLFRTPRLEGNIEVANEAIEQSIRATGHGEGGREIHIRQIAFVHIDCLSTDCGKGKEVVVTVLM